MVCKHCVAAGLGAELGFSCSFPRLFLLFCWFMLSFILVFPLVLETGIGDNFGASSPPL